MTLYESWISQAYDQNGSTIKTVWDKYIQLEQKVYENMLSTKNPAIKGTVKQLAEKHGMELEQAVGFLDGINEALDTTIDIEAITEETDVDTQVDFERLFKKMVEFKADHLYTLPEWKSVFSADEQKRMYTEQKQSTTIRRETAKIGRNDPCHCNSGKKYKKCCAS